MPQTDRVFAGSVPALYDRYLGPLIFEPYAADMTARVAAGAPRSILETAAGTGILTHALARVLPEAGITATDLNQPMLDFAAARPGVERVVWRQADAQNLPFGENLFDIVVCQFGAMFFPDRTAAYREARRVLKPGGRFLFSVWDRIAENDFAAVVTDAVAAWLPAGSPLPFLARIPHGYHDVGVIESELRRAGFTRFAAEIVVKQSRAPSPREPAIGYCEGTPMRGEIESGAPGRLTEITEAAVAAVAAKFGDGTVDAKMQAIVVAAEI